jgi:hypothetical protein
VKEMLSVLAIVVITVFAGCSSEAPSAQASVDPVVAFCDRVRGAEFDAASSLVARPSRFYRSNNGEWVMSGCDEIGKEQWSISGTEEQWISRFKKGYLREALLWDEASTEDVECRHLVTGVMCDTLQMNIRFVSTGSSIRLGFERIGSRTHFRLDE